MSRRDDDYEDDDELDDEDDEGGLSGSTSRSNPFSSGGASVRGAGLPARPSSSEGGSGSTSSFGSRSSEGNAPSPLSRPTLGGSNPSAPKPPERTSFGGGGSSTSPFNRPASDRPTTPGTPSARPALKADDDDKHDDRSSGSGLGSRSPFGSGSKPDDKKDDRPSGGLGGLGSRAPFGSGSKPDDKKDDRPSGGLGGLGSRAPFGSGSKPDDRKDAKKDDKPSGGGLGGALGGLGSRLPIGGGGNKPDDKRDARKDDKPSGGGLGGALGGLGSRLPIGGGGNKPADKKDARKDDKPSGGGLGGALGGLGGRLPFGGKPDDKKDARKDDKPSGGLGGLGGRLPLGGGNKPNDKKDAKKDDKPAGGAFGGLGGRLPLGGGGQRQETSSSAAPGAAPRPGFGSGAPAQSPLGAQKGAAKPGDKKPAKAGSNVSFSDRLRALNPFAGTGKDKAAKPRTSKGVKVEQDGLTLDNKLDILGIAMVIGSLVLALSSLSPTKGALTESINGGLSYAFGWGAVAAVIVIFSAGLWLLARHFGDEAPTVSRTRLVGFVILFLAALSFAQFIDAMNYAVGTGQNYLQTVRSVFLPIAYSMGRGGGYVGGEIYFLLLSNFGEVGGFLIVILALIIGIMLSLNLSVADFAMIAISNFRNLRDAYNRRSQRMAALRMEKQQALALAAAAAAVNAARMPKTQPEPLPAPAAPALPLPTQAALPMGGSDERRSISISTGGRTSTVAFPTGEGEPIPVQTPQPVPTQAAQPAPAGRGGLLGGLRRPGADKPAAVPAIIQTGASTTPGLAPALPAAENRPVTAASAPAAADQAAAKQSGGLRGLFNRGGDKAAKPEPAAKPQQTGSGVGGGVLAGLAGGAAGSLLRRREDSTLSQTPEGAPLQATPAAAQTLTTPAARTAPASSGASPFTTPAPNRDPSALPFSPRPSLSGDGTSSQTPTQAPTPAGSFGGAPSGMPTAAPARSGEQTSGASQPEPAGSGMSATPTSEPAGIERPAASLGGHSPAEAAPSRPVPFQRQPLTPDHPTGESAAHPPASQALTAESAVDRSALPSFKGNSDLYAPGNPVRGASAGGTAAGSPPPAPPSARTALGGDSQPVRASAPPPAPRRSAPKEWKLPEQATLLASGDDQEVDHELLLKRARIIEETLSSFGAPGRVVDVRTGPVVTQFGVEPDYIEVRGGKKNRVKVGAIAALDKDMQLALGAKSIRIEAPVPGKGYVGIEVPNEKAEIVRLRDVLEADQFKKIKTKSPLGIALGQGVDGTPVAADLSTMPHLLIAGTTGSGKSVCVNAIISSLLLNNTPRVLKFIMVDPKRVELTQYNGIPHLIAPVVVELERIVSVLKWVTREMDERYRKFSQAAARNIEDYNKHLPSTEDPMPYIVVIIDELADLMMLAPDETERVITRIAALARATGIHLVIATQRPSVDVVTGLIKANFPARIAFAVAGSVDSRVILDQPGAERLLGRGDMLYMSGDSPAPQRLQGVFVSDQEIGNITRYWRGQVTEEELMAMFRPLGATLTAADDEAASNRGGSGAAVFSRSASGSSSSTTMPWERTAPSGRRDVDDDDEIEDDDDDGDDVGDEMYEQAVEMVRRLNRASVSLLQRRLRIGYTRAARLIDMMEERGVVGPATEGSKPREVLTNH